MKNIGASVSAALTQEQKTGREEEEVEVETREADEEEEYNPMRNEMIFFLEEAPEYQISAVAEWAENTRGDVVGEPDTYFLHVMTGQRCESVWSCLTGWSEPGEGQEKWETLCERIEELDNLEAYICDEKRVGLRKK